MDSKPMKQVHALPTELQSPHTLAVSKVDYIVSRKSINRERNERAQKNFERGARSAKGGSEKLCTQSPSLPPLSLASRSHAIPFKLSKKNMRKQWAVNSLPVFAVNCFSDLYMPKLEILHPTSLVSSSLPCKRNYFIFHARAQSLLNL